MTETTASALPAYSGPCDCGRGMAHRLNPDVMSDSHDRWCSTRAVPSDARWESLKAYLDSEVASLRAEMEAETESMRRNLRHDAMLLANVRQHMDELERQS